MHKLLWAILGAGKQLGFQLQLIQVLKLFSKITDRRLPTLNLFGRSRGKQPVAEGVATHRSAGHTQPLEERGFVKKIEVLRKRFLFFRDLGSKHRQFIPVPLQTCQGMKVILPDESRHMTKTFVVVMAISGPDKCRKGEAGIHRRPAILSDQRQQATDHQGQ